MENRLLIKKDVVKAIIYTILTFGIYSLFWLADIMKRIRLLANESEDITGEFLLFIFIPLYSVYWMLTRTRKLRQSLADKGLQTPDNSILNTLFVFFGLTIIAYVLLQNDLNAYAQANLD